MMRRASVLVLLCLGSSPDAAPGGGTVNGGVIVARDGKKVTNAEHVWVYLKPVRGRRVEYGKGQRFKIEQKGKDFKPKVTVVPVGAEVAFPNVEVDATEHNVFSPSDPPFDLKRFKPGNSPAHVFGEPGQVSIYCDIHKDMWAKVKVIDSAWYAEVKNGTFTIANVPAGRYKVVAWAPDSDEVKSPSTIVVSDGQTVTVDPDELHLQLGKPNLLHTRKDGSAYPPY